MGTAGFSIYLYPVSDDTFQWSKYPNSGNNFDKVDEEVADEDETYVYLDTDETEGNIWDLYNLPVVTAPEVGDLIDSFTVYMRSKYTSEIPVYAIEIAYQFAGDTLRFATKIGQENFYKDFSVHFTAGYSWDEISNLKIGVAFEALPGESPVSVRVTQLYIKLNCSRTVANPKIYVMGYF